MIPIDSDNDISFGSDDEYSDSPSCNSDDRTVLPGGPDILYPVESFADTKFQDMIEWVQIKWTSWGSSFNTWKWASDLAGEQWNEMWDQLENKLDEIPQQGKMRSSKKSCQKKVGSRGNYFIIYVTIIFYIFHFRSPSFFPKSQRHRFCFHTIFC
jgi:hypothetical protein